MKVLIAASNGWETAPLRDMLGQLDSGCRIEVTEPVQGGLSFSIASPADPPDLVLVDVDAVDAGATIRKCIRAYPRARVIATGSCLEDAYVAGIFGAGALGYLPKSYSQMIALGVLRLALSDGAHHPSLPATGKSDPARARVAPAARAGESSDEFGLTERQVEVLSLAAQGKSNQAIARHLGITEGTTKVHMTSIFKALNVQNRAEAVLLATRMQSISFNQIKEIEGGALDLDWLLPHMSHRRAPRGSTLFKKGQAGAELWYLQRGTIRLEEIGMDVSSGAVFGEIGIFSPSHERTCTAVCATDVDLFTLSSGQVKRLYLLNPQFALYLVHLIAKRLMADLTRTV